MDFTRLTDAELKKIYGVVINVELLAECAKRFVEGPSSEIRDTNEEEAYEDGYKYGYAAGYEKGFDAGCEEGRRK